MPIANPILRGLAWMIDSVMIAVALIVFEVAAISIDGVLFVEGSKDYGMLRLGGMGMLASVVSFGVDVAFLAGLGLLQAHWGNTTGKRFLQILIVDQHGLKPRRRVLAARTAFQFSWAWAVIVILGPLAWLGLGQFGEIVLWLVLILIIAEAVSVLIRSGKSLHDSIFSTRVVLDASPESQPGRAVD